MILTNEQQEEFKTRYYFNVSVNTTFKWYKFTKFRGANCMDIYLLGLKINYGLPYLKNFIYESGYDAGFRGD